MRSIDRRRCRPIPRLAKNLKHNRNVALKVLKPELAGDGHAIKVLLWGRGGG